MRGKITRVGERYVVALSKDDQVSVLTDRVAWRCDSLEDAYQRQRSAIAANGTADKHLELADWCLRYELMRAAAAELMEAMRLDPENPRLARFEKRLRVAARETTPVPASRRVRSGKPVSQAHLNRLVRDLPSGTVQQFTTNVQPLLINRCGSAHCHGSGGESSFQLVRPTLSRTIPRRFTQKNLLAAVAQIDREVPGNSPLLTRATAAHGLAKRPALDDHDVKPLKELAAWIHRVSRKPVATQPAEIDASPSVLLQPGKNLAAASPRTTSRSQAESLTRTAEAKRPDQATRPPSVARIPPSLARGARPAPASDPFDPEVFNRRHLKR